MAGAGNGAGRHPMEQVMKFEIPQAMKAEHDELHNELVQATKAAGQTGDC